MRPALPALVAAAALVGANPATAEEEAAYSVEHMRWRGHVLVVRGPVEQRASPALRGALSMRITVDWEDAPLREVVDFLHRACGANIVLDPRLEAVAPPVTFNATDMTAGTVLDWVATLVDGKLSMVGEAAWLGAERYRSGQQKLAIYDVTDIVTPLGNFPGPDLALTADGQAEWSPIPLFGDERGPDADEAANELAEMLEDELNR